MEKKKKKIRFWLAMVGMAAAVASASQPKYDIDISVKERKIENLGPQGLSLVFYLNLANLASSPYFLVTYDYRVMIENIEYINLQTTLDEPIRVESRKDTLISLPLKITYALLFKALSGIKDKDKLVCNFGGGMTFQDERRREKRIPMFFSGEFPVFKDLEVKIQPLVAKGFSVGGTELSFRAKFQNPNGFELRIEKLTYKLELNGRPIAEGAASEVIRMESRGEGIFSLPLLLDFFELGKDVYLGLEESQVVAHLSGQAEARTVWGRLKIPFDRSEKISVVKVS